MPNLASLRACTACMACIDSCTKKALSFYISDEGYYQIKIDPIKCVECGRCSRVCPVLNYPSNPNRSSKKAFAVWDQNEKIRAKSSSGGAFSAIARFILEKHGVVYGAAIEGFKVKHTRVTSLNQLYRLQGSKYQQSEVSEIYKQVKADLLNGLLVLFSGMSCQIAALISYLGKTDKSNLYTIDTICGGVSTLLPMLQLEKQGKYVRIISFRDKQYGWKPKGFHYSLKMQTPDGVIEDLSYNNAIIKSFCTPVLKRFSCINCKFKGLQRFSDATICDFWGIKNYKDQHYNGVSGLIVNNQRIEDLIKNSSLEKYEVSLKNILDYNPSYYWNYSVYLYDIRRRKKALNYLQSNDINAFMKFIIKKPGVVLRILLKINEYMRSKYYNNYINSRK